MSVTIPANLRTFTWASPDGRSNGKFVPNGRVRVGRNFVTPNWRSSEQMFSARIFVGFNVGHDAVYSMDDIIPIVKEVRIKQGIAPDASFVYQKGMYTHMDGSGTVTEEGAQIILLNLSGASQEEFTNQMIQLANVLRDRLQQEAVIVEIQQGGMVKEVIGVTATETEDNL
jgi:hypothetical protein